METAIHSKNTEVVEVWGHRNLKLRPIFGRPNFSIRRRSYFLDTHLKPYIKHV